MMCSIIYICNAMHFDVATTSLGVQVKLLPCDSGVKLCSVKTIPLFKENCIKPV